MGNCVFGPKLKKVDGVFNPYASKKFITDPPNNGYIPPRGASGQGITFPSQCSYPLPMPTSQQKNPVGKNKNGSSLNPPTESQILASPGLKSFLYSELVEATASFSEDNLLGEGGFGCVYKGWLDTDTLAPVGPGLGMAVAVKRLRPQGHQGHKEWLAEVNYLGRLHHPNLVKLLGFCLKGENRLLVYEYMPQGSFEDHLFRSNRRLSWETRMKIAIGAARGLTFLHSSEPQIIYRDFKASNILLDSEFNAKLSDFGLAKSGPIGDQTHVSTIVMGTEGYAAPEYIRTGRLTAKCDIYSFGVVLFEMITGRIAIDYRRAKEEQNLVRWVRPHLRNKRALVRIMDNNLEGQYPRRGAFVVATLASHCVNQEHKFRPPMSEVLGYLEQLQSQKFLTLPSPAPDATQSSSTTSTTTASTNWSPINRAPGGPPRQVPLKSQHHSRLSGLIESR